LDLGWGLLILRATNFLNLGASNIFNILKIGRGGYSKFPANSEFAIEVI
jgi:hypothetical protein